MTEVAETSISAYHDILESGQVSEQATKVLKALQALDHPPTINELSMGPLAGWQKSTISGRLNDLKDEGLVHVPGKRADKHNNRKAKIWELTIQ
ncbi:MAG: hypothetical protein ABEJ07_05230 [Candidatus Nanohaloarchaea archaeon]